MIYRKIFLSAIAAFFMFSHNISAQTDIKKDSTGLPGDNFSLQGALDLFSKAKSPEDFEKSINEEKNNVNNLDLNGDGKIDYIKVIDKKDNNVHAIVLQAVISKEENQDIAVIEIEKKGDKDAMAQIVGDEDIYGKETYVEPKADDGSSIDENPTKSKNGPAASEFKAPVRLYFNVWAWPCVRYMYDPVYVVYVSPWQWYTYPRWWNPWRPVYWHTFYPRTWGYHRHCVVVSQPRFYGARKVYAPHRTVSKTVYNRNERVINNYRTTNKIVINKNDSRGRGNDKIESRDRSNINKTEGKTDRTSRDRTNNSKVTPQENRDRRQTSPGQGTERTREPRQNPQTSPEPGQRRENRTEQSPQRKREDQSPANARPGREQTSPPQQRSGNDQPSSRQNKPSRSEQRAERSQQRSQTRSNSRSSAPPKQQGSSRGSSPRSGNR